MARRPAATEATEDSSTAAAPAKPGKKPAAKRPQFAAIDSMMAVYTLADIGEPERTSFGNPALDFVTGGGIPRGMITEVFGVKGSGKTLSALRLTKEAIAGDPDDWALYLDAERTVSQSLAAINNIHADLWGRILVIRTNVAEVCIGLMEAALTGDMKSDLSGYVNTESLKGIIEAMGRPPAIVVWDSLAMSLPVTEMEQGATDNVGYPMLPRVLGRKMPRLVSQFETGGIPLVVANHIRQNLKNTFSNEFITPGGEFMQHCYALRMETSRSIEKKGPEQVSTHTLTVRKSKIAGANEGFSAQFRLSRVTGFDMVAALLDGVAVPLGLIEKGNAGYYTWRDLRFQAGTIARLRESAPLLVEDVRNATGLPALGGVALDEWAAGIASASSGSIPTDGE